jgi:dolichyl-phosphate beta-glucosyltransferase
MSEVRLSVVVPAYNEEGRLAKTLPQLHAYYAAQSYSFEVLVVSDGSSDSTGEIVKTLAKDRSEIKLVEYQPNRGKGFAVRLGMLQASGDLILFCDADLATPQEETEKLLAQIDAGADIAIGSRPLRKSTLEVHQPFLRELMGRLGNKLIQLLAIKGIEDTQCGFKLFTSGSARAVFRRCKLNGFSFDFEALMIARDLGYRIDEVPIRWSHQEGSKVVPWRDFPRAFRDLVKLRLTGKAARLKEA